MMSQRTHSETILLFSVFLSMEILFRDFSVPPDMPPEIDETFVVSVVCDVL